MAMTEAPRWSSPDADPIDDIRSFIAGMMAEQPPMSFVVTERTYRWFRYAIGRFAIGKPPSKRSRPRFMGRARS